MISSVIPAIVRIFFLPFNKTVGYITGGCLKSKSNVKPRP